MYAVGIVNIGVPFQNGVKQQVLSPAQINKHKYSIVCFLEAVEKVWQLRNFRLYSNKQIE